MMMMMSGVFIYMSGNVIRINVVNAPGDKIMTFFLSGIGEREKSNKQLIIPALIQSEKALWKEIYSIWKLLLRGIFS